MNKIDEMVLKAIESRASDIHFLPARQGGKVQFRIDGVLHDHCHLDEHEYPDSITTLMGMSKMDPYCETPQDARVSITKDGKDFDLRVACAQAVTGKTIAIRILDRAAVMLSLDDVCSGDETARAKFDEWCHRPNGMIFTAGPTGSGKTTVLYALLNQVKSPEIMIISVDDPVEYLIDGTVQLQVDRKHGVTAPALLRSVLRQDPDVILLGQTLDPETLQMALDAALAGHLVMTTIHGNSACEALQSLVGIGLPSRLLRDALIGISAQKLMRRLCPDCKEAYKPTEEDLALAAAASGAEEAPKTLYRAKGCDKCQNIGYSRRLAIYEQLEPTRELWKAVEAGLDAEGLESLAVSKHGFQTLWDFGWKQVANGKSSVQELLRVAGLPKCKRAA